MIGDLNRAVGSIIEGNNSTVSTGGQMLRDLLEQEQEEQEQEEEQKKGYFLLNASNMAIGGSGLGCQGRIALCEVASTSVLFRQT